MIDGPCFDSARPGNQARIAAIQDEQAAARLAGAHRTHQVLCRQRRGDQSVGIRTVEEQDKRACVDYSMAGKVYKKCVVRLTLISSCEKLSPYLKWILR
jgi:hypothetical protein